MFKKSDFELIDGFGKLSTRESLADLLEISDEALRFFIYGDGKYYTQFDLLKRNGSYRNISAPNKKLKYVQKKLAHILNLVYKPKICVTGFVKNRSILDNASKHKNKKIILNIDLKDFFDQIHFGRVRGLFLNKPYEQNQEVATILAQLTCFDGKLPQGAPTSPVISNMICRRLDYELLKLSRKSNITYSRYADDLVFSTFKPSFSNDIVSVVNGEIFLGDSLISVIENNSLKINKNKINIRKANERQEVTGIIVNKYPNIKKEYIKEIRAILYNCKKNGIYESALVSLQKGLCKNLNIRYAIESGKFSKEEEMKILTPWLKEHIKGRINFIKEIRGNNLVFQKYALIYNQVFNEEFFKIKKDDLDDKIFLVQRRDGCKQGSSFILNGIGMVSSYHVFQDGEFYYTYKSKSIDKTENVLTLNLRVKKFDKDIDYVVFDYHKALDNGFQLGNSDYVQVEDPVKLIGFPNSIVGSPYTILNTSVTAKLDNIHGAPLFTVSNTVQHGMSGGVVLDQRGKVIGVIKGGTESFEEYSGKMGFVPINTIMKDFYK